MVVLVRTNIWSDIYSMFLCGLQRLPAVWLDTAEPSHSKFVTEWVQQPVPPPKKNKFHLSMPNPNQIACALDKRICYDKITVLSSVCVCYHASGRLVCQWRAVAMEIRPDMQAGGQLLQVCWIFGHLLQMDIQIGVNVPTAVETEKWWEFADCRIAEI